LHPSASSGKQYHIACAKGDLAKYLLSARWDKQKKRKQALVLSITNARPQLIAL
jgi:hypothetical protein